MMTPDTGDDPAALDAPALPNQQATPSHHKPSIAGIMLQAVTARIRRSMTGGARGWDTRALAGITGRQGRDPLGDNRDVVAAGLYPPSPSFERPRTTLPVIQA